MNTYPTINNNKQSNILITKVSCCSIGKYEYQSFI